MKNKKLEIMRKFKEELKTEVRSMNIIDIDYGNKGMCYLLDINDTLVCIKDLSGDVTVVYDNEHFGIKRCGKDHLEKAITDYISVYGYRFILYRGGYTHDTI